MSTAASTDLQEHDKLLGIRKDTVNRYDWSWCLLSFSWRFALFVDRFLTATNLLNIAQQISMLTIVGAGLTFGFAAREMDLSVGYAVGLSGILVPLMLINGYSLPVAAGTGLCRASLSVASTRRL